MGKSLIITEKPSVAREFARILGVSGVGIEDPMTEKPGVRLAMECAYQNGRNILWQKEK